MIEWFKSLSPDNWIAIAAIAVPVIVASIVGLFNLFGKKTEPPAQQKTIQQQGKRHTAIITDDNKGNVAGRDIHIHMGVDTEDVLKALKMIDTSQSNKLASELKKFSNEKLNTPTELIQDYHTKEQIKKEFQFYSELWKALVDVRSSIIITPTVDKWPKGKSAYDIYKDRCGTAIDAYNKAKNLFENNRPFYHDDVSKITKEFLGLCRGYIFKVQRALRSETFDDKLYDEADELREIIPKAIDEIEKAIKVRIGLLPMAEVDDGVPIGPGLGSIVEITNGSIIYKSNTSNFKPLIGLKMSIIGGYIKRNGFGKLEAYIQTDIPFQSLQRLNEKLGLDAMRLLSERNTISEDVNNPVVFTSSTSHILPQGEMVLNLSTWQEEPFLINMHVQAQTTASGHLNGKVFQGKFEAILTYHEINLQIGLKGDFQAHLS
jgi:hypothetical protein